MWYIVVVEQWVHYDSEFSKVRSIPVYAVSYDMAVSGATEGMTCYCIQQVISVGRCKPVIEMDENW